MEESSAVAVDRSPGFRSGDGWLKRGLAWLVAHPIAAVACVAAATRLVVMTGILVLVDGPVFNDVTYYTDWARQLAGGDYAYFGDGTHWDAVGNAAFVYPIALLYEIFGVHAVIGALLSVAFGVATAVLVARLALEVLPARWALLPGLVVALLPSVVLWSAIPLKDAESWAMLASLGLVVAVAGRSEGRKLLYLGLAAAALLAGLTYLREHTMVVAVWALLLSAWVGQRAARAQRVAGALVVGICVPWLLTWGPAGIDVISGAGSLSERRALNAREAETALVPPAPGGGPTPSTEGSGPATPFLAADWEELRDTTSEGLVADLAYLPRGITVMLFEPYPWRSASNARVAFAKLETVVWYPLLALGIVGLASVWRHRRILLYPTLVGGGTLIMYALSEGNFGTAYRHRAEFIWVVALLAAFGARRLWTWQAARRGT